MSAQNSPNSVRGAAPLPVQAQPQVEVPVLPRGQKLMLKDGTFQLVSEYHVEGDRVRYYSTERSQWEVIPTALVDWDATKKAAAAEAHVDAVEVANAKREEDERRILPLDIDASLEITPGVFLPPGEGVFVFDTKHVLPLTQIDATSKLSKKHKIEQVLVPIPIVPTRHTISIAGAHAKLRLHTGQLEFYVRTTDAGEPELDLVRVKIHGDRREVENLDELFSQHAVRAHFEPLRVWTIAQGVYRFTLNQPLEPGEYALTEIVQRPEMSLYVWDFGVDGNAEPGAPKAN